jgi:hypothetical protein
LIDFFCWILFREFIYVFFFCKFGKCVWMTFFLWVVPFNEFYFIFQYCFFTRICIIPLFAQLIIILGAPKKFIISFLS